MTRETFRQSCVDRDGGECLVPWCSEEVTVDPEGPGEVHHIVERRLWEDGGYVEDNGACVCSLHHKCAEPDDIPPQAFWRWAGVEDPPLPDGVDFHSDKWGNEYDTPPWKEHRANIKYPSTRHLLPLYWQSERGTAEERTGRDDTGLNNVNPFIGRPVTCTVKMDGSNAMLVADAEQPVRARNGSHADHRSFDYLKDLYWQNNVYEELPEQLQVFGEWLYAKHSIHYGCDCEEPCEDTAPAVRDYFQVFGVYDTHFDMWLSWPETEYWADRIGFTTTPLVESPVSDDNIYMNDRKFVEHFTSEAERIVDMGHEGIVIRSKFPMHYHHFPKRVGKYVRPNHVKTDEHWSHGDVTQNVLK